MPEIVTAVCRSFAATAAAADAVAVARVVRGPSDLMGGALFVRADGSYAGGFGDTALEATARAEATVVPETGRTGTIEIGARGSRCREHREGVLV
ncbi:XdhC family protein [Streptomyces mirabilis]